MHLSLTPRVGLALAFVTACSPQSSKEPSGASQGAPDASAAAPAPAPAPTASASASASADASAASGDVPVAVDTRCAVDADCAIKNVGNCCGAYPACVNVKSPTDPEGVQARCQREGRMGVCGFPVIERCHCASGQCRAAAAATR